MTTVTYEYCNDVVSDNILFSIEINPILGKIKHIFDYLFVSLYDKALTR